MEKSCNASSDGVVTFCSAAPLRSMEESASPSVWADSKGLGTHVRQQLAWRRHVVAEVRDDGAVGGVDDLRRQHVCPPTFRMLPVKHRSNAAVTEGHLASQRRIEALVGGLPHEREHVFDTRPRHRVHESRARELTRKRVLEDVIECSVAGAVVECRDQHPVASRERQRRRPVTSCHQRRSAESATRKATVTRITMTAVAIAKMRWNTDSRGLSLRRFGRGEGAWTGVTGAINR